MSARRRLGCYKKSSDFPPAYAEGEAGNRIPTLGVSNFCNRLSIEIISLCRVKFFFHESLPRSSSSFRDLRILVVSRIRIVARGSV